MSEDVNPAAPEGVDGQSAPADGGSADKHAYWEQEARKAFAARDELKQRLKAYEDQSKQAKAAEAKRLAEAGEYKASYEQATEQLAQLLPIAQEYQALREHLDSQLAEQRKELPPEYRELIPESLPLQQQLAQLERVRKLVGKATNKPNVPPASPPSPAGNFLNESDPKARAEALLKMDSRERNKLMGDLFRRR